MRKPNYRFERAERDRAKKAKNDKKLQRQQERATARADDGAPEPTAENEPRESGSTPGIAFRRRCSDEPRAVAGLKGRTRMSCWSAVARAFSI